MIDPNQCSRCGEQATEIRSGPANGSYRLADLSCDCGWRWQLILPPLPPHWRWLYANLQVTPSKSRKEGVTMKKGDPDPTRPTASGAGDAGVGAGPYTGPINSGGSVSIAPDVLASEFDRLDVVGFAAWLGAHPLLYAPHNEARAHAEPRRLLAVLHLPIDLEAFAAIFNGFERRYPEAALDNDIDDPSVVRIWTQPA